MCMTTHHAANALRVSTLCTHDCLHDWSPRRMHALTCLWSNAHHAQVHSSREL